MLNPTSLSQTLDAVNAAAFENVVLSRKERRQIASWIATRQGLAGAYANTFAGFPHERAKGIVVFTGERFTDASARHILGEEASRALRLLNVRDASVAAALDRASEGLMQCLDRFVRDRRDATPGTYCCGKCSVGLWRNLLAGGLDRQEERLGAGVRYLRTMRDGKGEWRKFPFWYTVLALTEMNRLDARKEIKYAAPVLESAVARAGSTTYARRRRILAKRALDQLH